MGQRVVKRIASIVGGSLFLLGLAVGLRTIAADLVTTPSPSAKTKPLGQKPSQTANPRLVAANLRFGFKLFSQLLRREQDGNLFISPSSVSLALAMTYNGASGETKQAMARTLEINGMSLPELNRANADLRTLLENPDSNVRLEIANSLWARRGISFNPDFLQRNQTFYGARVTDLDFQDPQAPATINTWVKQNTEGKISQIIERLQSDDVLFLINAIYFKGAWTHQFDQRSTIEKPFTLANGQRKQHPMMVNRSQYRYYETDQFQAVSLPYGNNRVSMYVFLPKPGSNLAEFYKTLTPENWQRWIAQFRSQPGLVQIPRFKLEYGVELKDALSALGMEVAFDPNRASFKELSAVPTQIDQVKHKTFVEVNEAGTEAAAATSVGVVATSAPIGEPFTMTVDRPFFCAIRDNQTGTMLFMGSITDPKQ